MFWFCATFSVLSPQSIDDSSFRRHSSLDKQCGALRAIEIGVVCTGNLGSPTCREERKGKADFRDKPTPALNPLHNKPGEQINILFIG